MTSFALYRFPHARQCTLIEQTHGQPDSIASCRQLNGREGFVLAPFQPTAEQPIWLIRPDRVTHIPVEQPTWTGPLALPADDGRSDYAADFSTFHQALANGCFRKIVLSRCATHHTSGPLPARELFWRACQLYPRLFIALVSTPAGTWLAATPETLLEGAGRHWHTVALAGTMRLQGSDLQGEGQHLLWSVKNMQEQRYVATYIAQCLQQFSTDIAQHGPATVRAANLVHLRSDFYFTLPDDAHTGHLLQALHPTPAVCGLPKEEALRFILAHEHTARGYYSGFMGPLHCPPPPADHASQPAEPSTHLYVTLRCMHIQQHCCQLYAGGGLLPDSQQELEWLETEAKLETMRKCLAI